jgi:hypothetical protein
MAMKDRNLIAADVVAVIAAVCCTAPLLVSAVGASPSNTGESS